MKNYSNNWALEGVYDHARSEDKKNCKNIKSPDTRKMIRLKLDEKTSYYFRNNDHGRKQMNERIKVLDTINFEIIEP